MTNLTLTALRRLLEKDWELGKYCIEWVVAFETFEKWNSQKEKMPLHVQRALMVFVPLLLELDCELHHGGSRVGKYASCRDEFRLAERHFQRLPEAIKSEARGGAKPIIDGIVKKLQEELLDADHARETSISRTKKKKLTDFHDGAKQERGNVYMA